ncbi:MAG: tRNA epoxyqueuosine(34) reductase QueG [Planctomycetes bacterium]|nr:tRNA epoxyqueuosine(34) reductase QueG [Planctomycetota bacterium]
MNIEGKIKQKAIELGFDLVGITAAAPVSKQHADRLKSWLGEGKSADMKYMRSNFDKRIDPAKLLSGAKSVICVALNYKPKPSPKKPAGKFGAVANFAIYEDYHGFMKDRLFALAEFIKDVAGESDVKFKACVDSVPILERAFAQEAGLGFIGKNHMLINPSAGLQLLLGEIVTTLELQADKPCKDGCSDCFKCIRACPTGALSADGFDANKCISYLTIEHPSEITAGLGGKLFGCDECTLACPYDSGAPCKANESFKVVIEQQYLGLDEIKEMTQAAFDSRFRNTPIERIGLSRLKRNARACLLTNPGISTVED